MPHWSDDMMREQGRPTNDEFFSSNGTDGFYNGMVKDEDGNWIKSDQTLRKEEEWAKKSKCYCGIYSQFDCKDNCKQFED